MNSSDSNRARVYPLNLGGPDAVTTYRFSTKSQDEQEEIGIGEPRLTTRNEGDEKDLLLAGGLDTQRQKKKLNGVRKSAQEIRRRTVFRKENGGMMVQENESDQKQQSPIGKFKKRGPEGVKRTSTNNILKQNQNLESSPAGAVKVPPLTNRRLQSKNRDETEQSNATNQQTGSTRRNRRIFGVLKDGRFSSNMDASLSTNPIGQVMQSARIGPRQRLSQDQSKRKTKDILLTKRESAIPSLMPRVILGQRKRRTRQTQIQVPLQVQEIGGPDAVDQNQRFSKSSLQAPNIRPRRRIVGNRKASLAESEMQFANQKEDLAEGAANIEPKKSLRNIKTLSLVTLANLRDSKIFNSSNQNSQNRQPSKEIDLRDRWEKENVGGLQRQKQIDKKEMTIEQLRLHMMDEFKNKVKLGLIAAKNPQGHGKKDDGIESDDCKDNENIFKLMNTKEKMYHLEDLWRRCFIKARASQQVLTFFNDLSRKIQLFGVLNGLEQIKQDETIPPYIILLGSKQKNLWDIVNMFLLFYTATYMPYEIAFIDEVTPQQRDFNYVIDALFFLDIILTFFTQYEQKNGKLQHRLHLIALNYLKSWFCLDIVACFPFDITNGDGQKTNFQRLLRLLRLPRLYKMIQLMKILESFKCLRERRGYRRFMNKLKLNIAIVRQVQGMIAALLLTHLFACFWFLSSKLDNFNPDTWVFRMGVQDQDQYTQYIYSLYWSSQTVITLGYGDIPCVTASEMIIALVWMIFGVAFYSFIIGNFSSIISSNVMIQASIQMKIKSFSQLAQKTNVPTSLSKKIKTFIENNYEALNNQEEEGQLIKMLPPSLRDEVLSNTYGEIVDKLNFFKLDKYQNPDFQWKILPLLRQVKLEKGDILYWQGDVAEDIFFIINGSIKLYNDKGYPFVKYKQGEMFGDSDTLLDLQRDGKAIADSNLKLMVLKKDAAFEKAMDKLEIILMMMIFEARQKRDRHIKFIKDANKKAKMQQKRLKQRKTFQEMKKKKKSQDFKRKESVLSKLSIFDKLSNPFKSSKTNVRKRNSDLGEIEEVFEDNTPSKKKRQKFHYKSKSPRLAHNEQKSKNKSEHGDKSDLSSARDDQNALKIIENGKEKTLKESKRAILSRRKSVYERIGQKPPKLTFNKEELKLNLDHIPELKSEADVMDTPEVNIKNHHKAAKNQEMEEVAGSEVIEVLQVPDEIPEIPQVLLPDRNTSKVNLLDKVLLSAFKGQDLEHIYEIYPFLRDIYNDQEGFKNRAMQPKYQPKISNSICTSRSFNDLNSPRRSPRGGSPRGQITGGPPETNRSTNRQYDKTSLTPSYNVGALMSERKREEQQKQIQLEEQKQNKKQQIKIETNVQNDHSSPNHGSPIFKRLGSSIRKDKDGPRTTVSPLQLQIKTENLNVKQSDPVESPQLNRIALGVPNIINIQNLYSDRKQKKPLAEQNSEQPVFSMMGSINQEQFEKQEMFNDSQIPYHIKGFYQQESLKPMAQIEITGLMPAPKKRIHSGAKPGSKGQKFEETPARRRKSSARKNSRRASKRGRSDLEADKNEDQNPRGQIQDDLQIGNLDDQDDKQDRTPPTNEPALDGNNLLLIPNKKKKNGTGTTGKLTKPGTPSGKNRTNSVRCKVQRPSFRLMKRDSVENDPSDMMNFSAAGFSQNIRRPVDDRKYSVDGRIRESKYISKLSLEMMYRKTLFSIANKTEPSDPSQMNVSHVKKRSDMGVDTVSHSELAPGHKKSFSETISNVMRSTKSKEKMQLVSVQLNAGAVGVVGVSTFSQIVKVTEETSSPTPARQNTDPKMGQENNLQFLDDELLKDQTEQIKGATDRPEEHKLIEMSQKEQLAMLRQQLIQKIKDKFEENSMNMAVAYDRVASSSQRRNSLLKRSEEIQQQNSRMIDFLDKIQQNQDASRAQSPANIKKAIDFGSPPNYNAKSPVKTRKSPPIKEDVKREEMNSDEFQSNGDDYPEEEEELIIDDYDDEEEMIEFYGDPSMLGLVQFNADMSHIAMNIFETFTLFDLFGKGAQSLNQSIQLIQSQKQIINQRQENIERKLEDIELQLVKIRQLQSFQIGFSEGIVPPAFKQQQMRF